MKSSLIPITILALALMLASACATDAPTPTANVAPTATASPTPTPTPTPMSAKEWDLEDIQVNGSTVTVPVRVYAGIDVQATLDGTPADIWYATDLNSPTLMYVFQDVALGKHTVEVRDVVGHYETAEVVVSTSVASTATPTLTAAPTATSTPVPELPVWLNVLISRLQNEPVANPPAFITRHEYKGQTVYFLPQRCCDIYSNLYDTDGNVIGHPDGGITGQGDGRVPDFFEARSNENIVWRDQRAYDPSMVQVPAPIESVEILVEDSLPPYVYLAVVSGLPNACVTFGGYTVIRDGETVWVEMFNWKPSDPQIACAEIYGLVETGIFLGSDFDPDTSYTVDVNGVTVGF